MRAVTCQLLTAQGWADAAQLEFPAPTAAEAGPCVLQYDLGYASTVLEMARASAAAALSLRFPVEFASQRLPKWPSFLDDVRPMGSGRLWWLNRLGLKDAADKELTLLSQCTIAPVGNLRIKESVPTKSESPRFPMQEVVARQPDFLELAAERGAQVGGATGAGGESPKLLLRMDETQRVWIDTWQDDPGCLDRYYLVKFARGRSDRDRDILRSEYVYYRALHALGVRTISADGMRLEEGVNGPSLWLPRFDVSFVNGRAERAGMESMYSLLAGAPGETLKHQACLHALHRAMPGVPYRELVLDYLQRDLLNLIFGNNDNHGRNTSILKTDTVVLAPIYDFAPMKMDAEGIVRTTRWEHFESAGEVQWPALLGSFGRDAGFLRDGLMALATKLRELPTLLRDLRLPADTYETIGFSRTHERLLRWGFGG